MNVFEQKYIAFFPVLYRSRIIGFLREKVLKNTLSFDSKNSD